MALNPSPQELKELLLVRKKEELDRINKEKAREALLRIQLMLSQNQLESVRQTKK